MARTDDLASLAGDIKEMLGSLEQSRREVLAREAQLRNITDNMQDMIRQTDASGIILYSSPSYKTVMGYEPEAFLGKSAFEYIHPDDRHRAKTAFKKLINTASAGILEYRSRHSEGHYLWVEAIGKPLFDDEGRVTGTIFGTRDITEHKHAEAELNKYREHLEELVNKRTSALQEVNAMLKLEIQERSRIEEARARLADIIEATSDFVVTTDLHRRLLYCNRSLREMLGIGEAEEISSIPIADIHPEWANRIIIEQVYPVVIRDGIWQGEAAFLSRTGREVPVSQVTVAHRGTDGEVAYLSTIARDITALKQSEEQIRKLNEGLERRACELSAVNKELEAFSYSVSHDLRAPLRIIDGFCHVLTEDYHDKLDDEGREDLRIISSQCQRMGNLINDLLDLSRLSLKEMLLEDVDLSQIAESIAAELQEREPERQVSFAIATGLKVRGDRLLLQSVLENLMNNAWKFTSKHSQAKIEFGVTNINGEVAYFVRDDGAGFDMTYADKLFKPFQRLHTIKEFPGTGVGLASVQRIIQRHGGRVFTEGALDKGATFYFTLNSEL
ncbi:MAG: PAS domain S-box protein [Thermacetogeniaceae bacterium]